MADSYIIPLNDEELLALTRAVDDHLSYRDQIRFARLTYEVKQLRKRLSHEHVFDARTGICSCHSHCTVEASQ